jgi:hypothetical protein
MNAITACRLSREEFVNWMAEALAGSSTLPRGAGPPGNRPSDVTLVWPDHRPDARPIVCIAQPQLQEFFAFVSTYSMNVRPFTAYFRLMPLELVDSLESTERQRRNEVQLARIIAGASIAEVWIAAARQAERPSHVLPLLQSSLSLVLGQSILAGYGDNAFDWALREWMTIRARQDGIVSNRNAVSSSVAWRHIQIAMTASSQKSRQDHNHSIVAFIAAAVEGKSIRPDMLQRLSAITGPDLDLGKILAASREERISRFNATLADLKRRGDNRLQSEFLAGLMLAMAGNGSFEMLRSAREFEGWLDGAATWFGICAALFEESDVLAYAHSAGRRLVRDLLRREDPFDLPRADIASTELQFIESSKPDVGLLGAHGPRSIEVEILPNVVTRVPSPENVQSGSNGAAGRELLLRTLDEMSYLANRARRILADGEGNERQGDLYKPRRPGRNK